MKQDLRNKNTKLSPKQLSDFYESYAKIEKQKKESRNKVMSDQLQKATQGKSIVISNRPN